MSAQHQTTTTTMSDGKWKELVDKIFNGQLASGFEFGMDGSIGSRGVEIGGPLTRQDEMHILIVVTSWGLRDDNNNNNEERMERDGLTQTLVGACGVRRVGVFGAVMDAPFNRLTPDEHPAEAMKRPEMEVMRRESAVR